MWLRCLVQMLISHWWILHMSWTNGTAGKPGINTTIWCIIINLGPYLPVVYVVRTYRVLLENLVSCPILPHLLGCLRLTSKWQTLLYLRRRCRFRLDFCVSERCNKHVSRPWTGTMQCYYDQGSWFCPYNSSQNTSHNSWGTIPATQDI